MRTPSIRARIALWFGATLAVGLALFAAAGFAFVARSSLSSTDDTLDEALDAVESALNLEESEQHPPSEYLARLVQHFRFRDMRVAILNRATGRVYSSIDTTTLAPPDARAASSVSTTSGHSAKAGCDAMRAGAPRSAS